MRPDSLRFPHQPAATRASQPTHQRNASEAQHNLFAAIEHASECDLLPLLKEALAAGASLSASNDHGWDVYRIAVCNNRPHAINALTALRAEAPVRPDNGLDLLMQAAMWNYDECCDKLIWHVGMPLDAVDDEGRTALFHAVLHGCPDAAQVLLDYGADANASTTQLSDATLNQFFGASNFFQGREITLLMAATLRCDRAMMSKLIAHGADPHKGDFPPLHIAASQGDAATIAFLIEQGATIADSLDWATRTALFTAISTDAPLSCLRLLAADYPFCSNDVRDPDQVLAEAVRHRRTDAVALFLGHGARPDTHRKRDPASVWQIAVDAHIGNRADMVSVLDLLASTCAEHWNEFAINEDNAILAFDLVVNHKNDPASLANCGMYPSLLEGLHQRLDAMPAETEWQTMAQSALRAARLYLDLLRSGPETGAVPTGAASLSQDRDRQWHAKTERALASQSAWLKQAASFLVSSNEKAMQQALTLEFFQRMTASCSDDARLDIHIQRKLTEATCLPESITRLIARAWYEAARDARDWLGSHSRLAKAERLAAQRALLNIARRTELTPAGNPSPSTAAVMSGLQHAAIAGLALRDFCNDPMQWLMRKEQRSHLRPVDTDDITDALCSELGLPPDTSQTLADAWDDIIRQLATGIRGQGPHDWWRVAAKVLSQRIADTLVLDTSVELPQELRNLIEHWCVKQTGTLRGRVSVPVVVNKPHDRISALPLDAVSDNQSPRPSAERHQRPPAEGEPLKKKLRRH